MYKLTEEFWKAHNSINYLNENINSNDKELIRKAICEVFSDYQPDPDLISIEPDSFGREKVDILLSNFVDHDDLAFLSRELNRKLLNYTVVPYSIYRRANDFPEFGVKLIIS